MASTPTAVMPVYTGDAAAIFLNTLQAPYETPDAALITKVGELLAQVRTGGDFALEGICQALGDATPRTLMPDDVEVQNAIATVDPAVRAVIERSAERVQRFGEATLKGAQAVCVSDDAVESGLRWQPVASVGCYVPGGRYPLPSTALMTAITAKVAGVPEIWIVSPLLGPEVLLAGQLAGVTGYRQIGGAHGVAALAYGTETITPVTMIVGPGNAWVTEAKRQLQGVIGIDALAGPSEVVLIADADANPDWVAVDLLAQAEHDPNARAYCLVDSLEQAQAIQQAVDQALSILPLAGFLKESLAHSGIVVLENLEACAKAANTLAPEHLALMVANPDALTPYLTDYGALFMGYNTPVPVGDYMAGPNHTLPTARAARFSGGLTPWTFLRPQTWMRVRSAPLICQDASLFAATEGLEAHRASAAARL
ncbi:MAG: histidinol dehydrogenase [Vampirovibrionales bacterium]|nr:histidinol dehydrogenase [Vampirovibrionales bacterium]